MSEPGTIISNSKEPSLIRGVHGGVGDLYWKRVITGGHMHGNWESFEYVRLDAGGTVGTHEHSWTEEIYIFLTGTGIMRVNEDEFAVSEGDVVLTPLTGVHGLRNESDAPIEFLVIETLPPEIVAKMPSHSLTLERADK